MSTEADTDRSLHVLHLSDVHMVEAGLPRPMAQDDIVAGFGASSSEHP